MRCTTLALLAALAATPAAAQEWQVARESFAFAGTRLTIRVDAENAGTLRIIRGAPGSVRVASRAPQGFTAAGLGEREELTLTAAGPGPVDYMVAVPDRVWIEVRLPGHTLPQAMAGHARSRSFEWPAAADAPGAADAWVGPLPDTETPAYTTYVRGVAPSSVSLPALDHVRSLAVRIEGDRFRILASRPLAVETGSTDRVEIRPAAPPIDLVLSLPADTRRFQLETDGYVALRIDADGIRAFCSPLTRQRLSNEREWLTFNPVDGALRCTDRPVPRHEG